MRSATQPKRIQRKRTKGWKMPPNTIYVGPGTYGNPFIPGPVAYLSASAWFREPTFFAGFRGNLMICRDAHWAIIAFRAWLEGDDYRAYLPPQVFKVTLCLRISSLVKMLEPADLRTESMTGLLTLMMICERANKG